ncbi:MAG: hypothetical protein NTU89_04305 [Candidatus Dependentiae bacterium]|nr:hypothetical protein [Candidatus Dependentiae bacterium]
MADKVTTKFTTKKAGSFKVIAAVCAFAGSMIASDVEVPSVVPSVETEVSDKHLVNLSSLQEFMKKKISNMHTAQMPMVMINPKHDEIEITGLDTSASIWSAASFFGLQYARNYFNKRSYKKSQSRLKNEIVPLCSPLDISSIHAWDPAKDVATKADDVISIASKRQKFMESLATEHNKILEDHNNKVKDHNAFIKNYMKKTSRARRVACLGRFAPLVAATGVYIAVASRDKQDEDLGSL